MGSGDINMKKSWHPRLQKNQEEVWLREQAAIAERKKLDELRREREQERQMQELKQIYEGAGGKKSSDRIDWMYASPAVKNGPTDAELEDYLLGKKRVDSLLQKEDSQQLSSTAEPGMISTQNANSAKDTAMKLREDPLLAIKQHEKAVRERLMKDPTRLKQLQERARMERGERSERGECSERSGHHHSDRHRRSSHRDSHERDVERRHRHEHDSAYRRHRDRDSERRHRHYRHDRHDRHARDTDHHERYYRRERYDRRERHDSREASPRRPRTQLDDATREARLAEMMSNAQEMHAARGEYVARISESEARQAAEETSQRDLAHDASRWDQGGGAGKASFLLEHQRHVYGQGGGMNLHDHLRRGQRYERVQD